MGKTPPQKGTVRVDRAERRAQVLEYTKAGYTQRQIAAALGIGQTTVRRDLDRALQEVYKPQAEAALSLEIARLDSLIAAFWQQAIEDGDPYACDRIFGAIDRRMKLLGIEKPQPVDTSQAAAQSALAAFMQMTTQYAANIKAGKPLEK